MKLKSLLAKPYAIVVSKRLKKSMLTAVQDQERIFESLLKNGQITLFGKDHHFNQIKTYEDFKKHVPLRDYEEFKPYIEIIKQGRDNVLWKGRPLYFAKTSGTTSGVKYIPITKDSISNHIEGARNALLCYIAETGNAEFTDGKMIFLSGSPVLERVGGIPTGRLSGIVNHHIPSYLRRNQLPSYTTNCIEEWEEKLEKIVAETVHQDMTLISGIPPWMQMYFDWLRNKNDGKLIKDIFPNLSVIAHGGVNFEPYKAQLFAAIGKEIDTIETFPASEGFFAFQDSQKAEGLLLNTNAGIFFEFIPSKEIGNEYPTRLSLKEVKLDENYALIINSNAGLWGYNIGDTVRFVSLNPYRIKVTGRTKHYLSAFGEHVIAEEVEDAMLQTLAKHQASVTEFTVAPVIQVAEGLPYHEWFVEFEKSPENIDAFTTDLNEAMCNKNIYYNDLITGHILRTLKITTLPKNAFIHYMKSIGRLGGQNKPPRLCNDRNFADALLKILDNDK